MDPRSSDHSKSLEQIHAEIDEAPTSERVEIVERVRALLLEKNDRPTVEDEEMFRRFIEGEVGAEDFGTRFAERV